MINYRQSRERLRVSSRARRSGGTLVETVVVINLLLVLILGVFEYGRFIMMNNLLTNAAREGARLVVINPSATSPLTTAQIQSKVTGFLAGQSVANLVVQVYQADTLTGANIGSWSNAPPGADIAVQIDCDYQAAVPITFGIMPSTYHLSSKSVMLTEAN